MSQFVKKLLYALLILWSVATVVFWLFSYSFPSPEDILVTDRTDEKTLQAIKEELHLDESLGSQYLSFLNDLSPIGWHPDEYRGNYQGVPLFKSNQHSLLLKSPYLRRSFQTGQFSTTLLVDAFKGTLVLALCAILFAAFVGILFGIWAAMRKGTWIDQLLLSVSTLGISVPSFFSAILLSWFFGYVLADITGLKVIGSLYDIDPIKGKYIAWKNLILPAIALGVRPLAIITQLTRNSMLDSLSQDYIRTARSKGLSENKVVYKHALKSALNPIVTSISGWFASLLAGAFFVEYIFGWKGLGSLSIKALETSDLPLIMSSVLFISVIFIAINFFVDYLYEWLDPRVSQS